MNHIAQRHLKAALFDLDGTIFDTEPQYTVFWGKTARRFRPDVPNLEYKIKGTTLTQIFSTYFPDPDVQAEINRGLDEWEGTMRYDFVPGAVELLTNLREHGVRCAVVTSSNQVKMQSVVRQRPDFPQLFDRILTSEDFSASKPAPDCYLLGARIFDADISECIVFEDAFNSLQAGMASGILTIGLTTSNPYEAIKDKCHHAIPNFVGLDYDVLEKLLNEMSSK